MVPLNIAYTAREITLRGRECRCGVPRHRMHDCLATLRELDADGRHFSAGHVFVVGDGAGRLRRLGRAARGPDERRSKLPREVALDDLMNIQYTSGTTGFPKGCMLTHRYWLTIGKVNAFRDGRHLKRILAATPFFYMDPQWLLLMAFYQRGTLFVARRQSSSPVHGLGSRAPHRVLPASRARPEAAARSARPRQRHHPRATSMACTRRSTRSSRSASTSSRAKPSA